MITASIIGGLLGMVIGVIIITIDILWRTREPK
jgi:uncharacterized membrane protein